MIIDRDLLETQILPQVTAPGQYLGGELNSVVKDWAGAGATMALAFPDLYEIGMSHLGTRLLYEAINNHSPHLCERVFMPQDDMAAALRRNGLPLYSLETRHALSCFDVVGYTWQYELSYTNILFMLDLAGIPLTTAERGAMDPQMCIRDRACSVALDGYRTGPFLRFPVLGGWMAKGNGCFSECKYNHAFYGLEMLR